MTLLCTECNQKPIHARGRCATCYSRAYKANPAFARHYEARDKTCRVCGDRAHAQGLCQKHYMRLYRHGRVAKGVSRPMRICKIEGCGKRHHGWGYCEAHYFKAKRIRKAAA